MSDMVIVEAEIGEDGQLTIQLPPDAPRGRVEVTVKKRVPQTVQALTPEEEAVLDAELEELLSPESLRGLGLTAEEIAESPEFGIWVDREDITDSAEFVAEMRRKSRQRRSHAQEE